MKKLLEIQELSIHFALNKGIFTKKQKIHAVNNVSFDVYEGETLGIVGESGCGKSSLARSLIGLNPISSGKVLWKGSTNLAKLKRSQWHNLRKEIQFVFQDPVGALSPRMTVAEILAEPLLSYHPKPSSLNVKKKVASMLNSIGLPLTYLNRYPKELSGGQCQRVGIARALILEPKLIICDESISALDASVKAQIINLLNDLQRQLNLTILFISHDLSIVKYIADRILVMYLGSVMELASKEAFYTRCYHPYSQALLTAVPVADPRIERSKARGPLVQGELPSAINLPKGCPYHTRCYKADHECIAAMPDMKLMPNGTAVACFKADS